MTDCLPSRADLVADLARANARIAELEAQNGAPPRVSDGKVSPEERLTVLAQLAPVGIYFTDPAGKCQYVNARWREMAGLTSEQALGQGWVQGLHPADRERVAAAWEQMVDAKGHWGGSYRLYNPELGLTTWVHGVAAPVQDSQGGLLGYVGINTDITALKTAEDQVRASRDELTAVVQGIADGVLVMTPAQGGRIVFANEAAVRLSGFGSVEAMLGSHPILPTCDIYDQNGQPVARARLPGLVAQSGQSVGPATLHFVDRSSGRDWWGSVRATPLFDQNGAVSRVVVVLRDVTVARQAAQRQQTILGGVQAGIILQAADGRITFANAVAARIFQMRTDEITGRTSMDTVWHMVDEAGQELEGSQHPSMITLRTGQAVHGAVRGLFADDPAHLCWLLIDTQPLLDPISGALTEVLVTFQEITPLVCARQALADSEARYRTLVETSPDGIALAEMDGTLLLVNARFATLLGQGSREQLMGRSLFELVSPQQAKMMRAGMVSTKDDTRPYHGHVELARGDGTSFMAEVSGSVIRDEQGAPRYLFGIVHDITQRRMIEERLREAQKLEAVGRLAGGVAHEFNNLLTVINGYSELALRDIAGDDPLRLQVLEIARAGARAASLTHQLLAYSRRQMLRRELLDLDKVIEGLAALLRPTLGEGVELRLELTGGGGAGVGRPRPDRRGGAEPGRERPRCHARRRPAVGAHLADRGARGPTGRLQRPGAGALSDA